MYKIRKKKNYFGISHSTPTLISTIHNIFPSELFDVQKIELSEIAGPCFMEYAVLMDYLSYNERHAGITYMRKGKPYEYERNDCAFYLTQSGYIKVYNSIYNTRLYKPVER